MGILIKDKSKFDELKNELTIKSTKEMFKGKEPTLAYHETSKGLYIPRFYTESTLSNWRLPLIKHFNFNGELKPFQRLPTKLTINEINKNKSVILSLPTGAGKTCIALYILAKLGRKTLIVVNKQILMEQWIERIKQFFGSDIKIGIIQGANKTMGDEPIHIGMLQTLFKFDSNSFDHNFLIVDEVHNIATNCFSRAFNSIGAKYQLGLSATPIRQDGLTKVIRLYMGEILDNFPVEQGVDRIKIIRLLKHENNYDEITLRNGNIHFSKMLTKMANDEQRNLLLLSEIFKAIEITGNYILVLSDRISQLEWFHTRLPNHSLIQAGGKYKKKKLEKTRVLLSTFQYMSEGVDISYLNVLVLATPRSAVVQSIGRIGRDRISNCTIVDVVDKFGYTYGMFNKRRQNYQNSGYIY
ncbi:MAG: DEAD/DEAH box helicase family protein [Clostridium sp.]